MRRIAAVWGLAFLLLLLGGAAARWLPRAWCPDFGLLLAVAAGLQLPGLAGCATAWCIGWTTDVLSGSALGHFALLRLGAWGLTRLAERQVHLRRAPVLMVFVAVLTVGDAFALSFAAPGARLLPPDWAAALVPHVLANVLAAPLVVLGTSRALARLLDHEGARGTLRLPVRSPLS